MNKVLKRRGQQFSLFILLLLIIEFLDELAFGYEGAALPLIRQDLGLDYVQIGLLMSVPVFFGSFIEPIIGILGDTKWRKTLLIAGGCGFAISLLLVGTSQSFITLMLAFLLFNPSSGAFIGMAESAMMDSDPQRHEQNMARWTFSGSIGVVLGSLLVGGVTLVDVSWRVFYFVFLILTVVVVIGMLRYRIMPNSTATDSDDEDEEEGEPQTVWESLRGVGRALKRGEVIRWLVLLEFSNLFLDVLLGYLALYMVDVVGLTTAEGALAVAVWTIVGLIGDFALILLLERFKGMDYMRYSVVIEFVLYIAFLLVPSFLGKLFILAFLGFFNAGWYAILKAELYSALPGQSSTVITLTNIVGLFATGIPLLIGVIAENFGLGVAMWLLLAGPIALFIGLPWRKSKNMPMNESVI